MNASRRRFLKMSGTAAGILAMTGAQRALGGSRTGLNTSARRDDQAIFDQVCALVEAYIAQYRLPGVSIGILHHDELLFTRAFGLKNTATGEPYRVEDVQCLESISSSVAATAIMQLVEEGRMDIDRPLTDYLPDFWLTDPRHTQITVRHIIGHSSGIPFALPSEEAMGPYGEFMNPYPGPDAAEQMVAAMAAEPISLLFDPGAGYNYSDLAYDLLAAVI